MDFDHSQDTITADNTADPIRIGGVAGLKVPEGTTLERVVENGLIRRNTTTGYIEIYNPTAYDLSGTPTGKWIQLDEIEELKQMVQGFYVIDMNGTTPYNMTASESKFSQIVVFNPPAGGVIVLNDDDNNPAKYSFLICGDEDVTLNCCSNTVNISLIKNATTHVAYGFGLGAAIELNTSARHTLVEGDPETFAPIGHGGAGSKLNAYEFLHALKRQTSGLATIDMLNSDYTLSPYETQMGTLVIVNAGDGTKELKLADAITPDRIGDFPTVYTFFIYDINPIFLVNADSSFSVKIEPLRLQQVIVTPDQAQALLLKADTSSVEPSTDRNYVTDSEKAVLAGSLNAGVYIQETEPVSATPYIWYKTNAAGKVIDILLGP